jgi:hypothetical protein
MCRDKKNREECRDEENVAVLKVVKLFAIVALDEYNR